MRFETVLGSNSGFIPTLSCQHSLGYNVETAQKPVIAKVLAFSLSLLKTTIWYEKYEIF